jgi:hypothetical protein
MENINGFCKWFKYGSWVETNMDFLNGLSKRLYQTACAREHIARAHIDSEFSGTKVRRREAETVNQNRMSVSEAALAVTNGPGKRLSWDEACGLSREGLQIFLTSEQGGELSVVDAEKFGDYNGKSLKFLTVDILQTDIGLPKLKAKSVYTAIRLLQIESATALAASRQNREHKSEKRRRAAQDSIDLNRYVKALQALGDAGDAAENPGANSPNDSWDDNWYGSCMCVCMFRAH